MPSTVPVVFEADDGAASLSGEEWARIESWADARQVRLVRTIPPPPPRFDESLSSTIEALIRESREAALVQDAERSERAISSAEEQLGSHPELPNAAWLMAEVLRARGKSLEAAALDEGRALGIGEVAPSETPSATKFAIDVKTESNATDAYVDGLPFTPRMSRPLGQHAVVVHSQGRILAGWLALDHDVVLDLPRAAGVCGRTDSNHALRPISGADRDCTEWVLAVRHNGALTAAICHQSECVALKNIPIIERGLPNWATVSLASAGFTLATVGAFALAGAFRNDSSEVRFVPGGVHQSGWMDHGGLTFGR